MSPDFLRAIRTTRSSPSWLGIKQFFTSLINSTANVNSLSSSSSNLVQPGRCNHFISKWCLLIVVLLCSILLLLRGTSASNESIPLWEVPSGYRRQKTFLRHRETSCTFTDPCRFALVADLDKKSKIVNNSSEFRSYLLAGSLFTDPITSRYTVQWDSQPEEIRSSINEGGRGLELSELILYNGHLLSFDDRTGVVFEYVGKGTLIPRHIISEGDGKSSSKGMKIEWVTEKDGRLWIGSFGKEYTDVTGVEIKSEAHFWVITLDEFGNIERKDWKTIYNSIRDKLGVPFPGYVLHEAINWSPHLNRWVILPRRVSQLPYDELKDEKRGSNIMILATKDFSHMQIRTVGTLVPERGYSSFKFVPGTHDNVVMAVKSVEDSANDTQKSYISLFHTLTGQVLLDDIEIPHAVKYEGVEFIPNEAPFSFLVTSSSS